MFILITFEQIMMKSFDFIGIWNCSWSCGLQKF